ncbi:MAG TPA: exosortase/archaeosortase family protein [Armatimonadota bacterium]|nr:exosortase/archaeosortase family protein [Armatimonadota bacterium]
MESVSDAQQSAVACKELTFRDIRWPAYIPIAIGIGLLIWLYMPIFRWWHGMWRMEDSYYSHGYLIPPISGFVVWLKRKRLSEMVVQPWGPGFVLVAFALIGAIVAAWASASSVCGLTVPLAVAGISLVLLGWAITRELAFPIGFLYFMCVLPTFLLTMISFRIQMLSTAGATLILRALTFDAYHEGASIILPNVTVLVGSPCSGFRMSITLLALLALFLFLTEGPRWGRVFLLFAAIPLAVCVNSIRIAMVALVGEFMGDGAMRFFHDQIAGPIEIVLAFTMLLLLARLVKCLKFNSMLMSS